MTQSRHQRFRELLSDRKATAGGRDYDDHFTALFADRKRIVELAVKYRLPAIYSQESLSIAGGLMSYGADFDDPMARGCVRGQDFERRQTG